MSTKPSFQPESIDLLLGRAESGERLIGQERKVLRTYLRNSLSGAGNSALRPIVQERISRIRGTLYSKLTGKEAHANSVLCALMKPANESINGDEMTHSSTSEYLNKVREITRKYNAIELKMNIAEIAATIALLITAYQLNKPEPSASPVPVESLLDDKSALPENPNPLTNNFDNSGEERGR